MSRFDSIVVGERLVSEHWLAEQFPATVTRPARRAWKEREDARARRHPAHRGLLAARSATRHRPSCANACRARRETRRPARAPPNVRRARSQLPERRDDLDAARAGGAADRSTPRAGVAPTGTPLLVCRPATPRPSRTCSTAEGAGQLLAPGDRRRQAELASPPAVISALFVASEPPAARAGHRRRWVLLAERERWPEGRWLAVDLATALRAARHQRRAASWRPSPRSSPATSLLPGADGTTLLLAAAGGVGQARRRRLQGPAQRRAGVDRDPRHRGAAPTHATAGLRSDVPGLAPDLTRQALRYLYRILFLLYAEARPELGVLPVGAPEYAEGYGLDRLRELVLTELTTETRRSTAPTCTSRSAVLFRLVERRLSPGDARATDESGAADDGGPPLRGRCAPTCSRRRRPR